MQTVLNVFSTTGKVYCNVIPGVSFFSVKPFHIPIPIVPITRAIQIWRIEHFVIHDVYATVWVVAATSLGAVDFRPGILVVPKFHSVLVALENGRWLTAQEIPYLWGVT